MKHDLKLLQEIIDTNDPHDKLRNDALVIRIAKYYAEKLRKSKKLRKLKGESNG